MFSLRRIRTSLLRRAGESVRTSVSVTCCGGDGSQAAKPITAKALAFDQHLLVIGQSAPSAWPDNHTAADPYLSSLTKATSILANLKISASFASNTSHSHATESTRDILVFPDMIRFNNVPLSTESFDLITRYLVECRLGVFDKTPISSKKLQTELIRDPCLVVCAHQNVDERCGKNGGRLIDALNKIIKDSSKQIQVFPASHLGGHDYAANLIAYPRGDWYGNLARSPTTTLSDAQNVVDSLSTGAILWDHWRGRVGLDAATTTKMSNARKDAHEFPQTGGCGSGNRITSTKSADSGKTPETIKVTYVLKNGQRIEVDAELSEFTPTDPANPYFRTNESSQSSLNTATPTPSVNESTANLKSKNQVEITFMHSGGRRHRVLATLGSNLMQVAKDNAVPTIDAVCGGNMECATCHVIIDKSHFDALTRATEGEEDMLEYAIGRRECSRLACQLKVSKEMEGMEVRVHEPASSEVFV